MADEKDIENLGQIAGLQNQIVGLLAEERSALDDIASIERQLVKAKQDALNASDQAVDLARAERAIADDLAANAKELNDLAKNKGKLSKTAFKDKQKELQDEARLLKVAKRRILIARDQNKLIQQVGDGFTVAAQGGIDFADNLKSGLEALPGGKALSRLIGLDDLSNRLADVAAAGASAYITAIQAGLPPAQALAASMKAMGTAMKALLSPAMLLSAALVGIGLLFMGISADAKKLAEETGVTFAQAKKLNVEAQKAQASFSTQLATVEDINAVQKEQLALLGSTALVNTEIAAAVAETGRAFGYSAQTAGQVQSALMLAGAEQREAAEIQQQTNKRALQEGLNVAAVQKDIAENAKGALKFLGGSPEKLADAAIEAGKLGVNLGTLTKVADALLDIEGSLTAQFEFQALSGKEINLDLARQKALRGDIAGATEEVLSNIESTAELDQMGVFAQEALAKATGVSVEELRKSLTIREKLGDLDAEAKAAAANLGLSAAELADMSADELQNRLAQQQSVDKAKAAFESIKNQLASSLLPLAEAFGAVFTLLGPVLKVIGFTIQTLLSPISFISNLINGTLNDMGMFQKIVGGILSIFVAIKATTMGIVGFQKLQAALAARKLAMSQAEQGISIGQLIREKVLAGLAATKNFLMSGLLTAKTTEAALETGLVATKTTQAGLEAGITTAKGVQAASGVAIAGSAATTAASTGVAAAAQGTLTAATTAGAGAQAAQAAAALTTNAAMTFGLGTVIAIAAAAVAIGGLIGYMAKAKKAGDIASPAKGKTMVTTKEGGLFETSDNDDVAAGPGLLSRLKGAASSPLSALGGLFGGGGKASDQDALMAKLDELIMAAKTPPPVYIGPKAVTELASALNINDSFQTSPQINGGTG